MLHVYAEVTITSAQNSFDPQGWMLQNSNQTCELLKHWQGLNSLYPVF